MDILPDIEDALTRETAAKDQTSEVNIRSCFYVAELLYNCNYIINIPAVIDQTSKVNIRSCFYVA